ncbi:MAG: HAMP domain-containing protein, partial [Myxococcales bacterium]|nr:HAMP domain-containing protein [Myxococcales bacterium]
RREAEGAAAGASPRVLLGIRGTLVLGLASLLLVAGAVATFVVTRLVGAEAEAQVLAAQRLRVAAEAERLAALCTNDLACHAALDRPPPADVIEQALVDGRLRVLAGALAEGAPRTPEFIDALQGGAASWTRIERPADDPRGRGVDHRVVHPVRLADGRRAALITRFTLDGLRAAVADRQRLVLAYLAFDFFAVLLFGLYLSSRALVRPLRELTLATERIDADGHAALPDPRGPAEIARLTEAFARMIERLRERNLALTRSLAALEAARDELVRSEKLATVGRLAAGVAHEIGNPLTAVLGFLEFLRDPREAPEALRTELLGRMNTELLRIRDIVRQLLDFSRPSPASPERVSLRAVAESAVGLIAFHNATRGVTVTIEGEAPPVFADPTRLRQVLVNLLLNAGAAMGGEGEIRVALDADAAHVRVQVIDQGPGVPADLVPNLFEPFATTKPVGEGTGLGLAIAARLVEEAGGRLRLTSPPGGPGAIFTLELPPSASI